MDRISSGVKGENIFVVENGRFRQPLVMSFAIVKIAPFVVILLILITNFTAIYQMNIMFFVLC